MPVDQRMTLSELYMVLPFYMQEQKQDMWCWAATTVSVAELYNPLSTQTQCNLATEIFRLPTSERTNRGPTTPLSNDQSCCDAQTNCNFGYVYGLALDFLAYPNTHFVGIKTIIECNNELKNWRPVQVSIMHPPNFTMGHSVILSGVYLEGEKRKVVINDPWSGIKVMDFEKLKVSDSGSKWMYTTTSKAS